MKQEFYVFALEMILKEREMYALTEKQKSQLENTIAKIKKKGENGGE